ncbi:MAG TPA: hypothetical protein VHQ41_00300 [Patescibacteria group bacterium]|jgi:nanoRNase/pAp phosphatase (c-di-AMP/oligoRNAs hydrolase)|nr:hypothetical protein [Patescibacteria group bacterium]
MTDTKTPEIQTILKTIGTAKQIAIVLPEQPNIDQICAGIALSTAISSNSASDQHRTVMLFSAAAELPELLFLKNAPRINRALNNSAQLAIKISSKNAQPGELRYEKSDDGLTVFVTPKEAGQFKESDVSVLPSAGNFDLVVIIGAANFEQLGSLYKENTKLFFGTPHINIDINPANEFYGTINYVQTIASSICEAVMDLVEAMPNALANETVSTALLAGIISQTSSFRDPKTTPQAMLKASRLVEAGAKQQDIIQHLFKTKPLPLLQLWGRALARLTALQEKQILTAIVTKSDLEKTNVGVESLPIVARDIVEMITGYSLVILLAELPAGGVQAVVAGLPFEDLANIATQLGSAGEAIHLTQLTGKYEYISVNLKQDLAQTQQQLSKLIENRHSVV